jgi:hypothetical protein
MNLSILGRKLRDQLHTFSGKLSTHFSKPIQRFVEQMLYGIQAGQDVKLSSIGRALGEEIALIKTEERLSRNLDHEGLEKELHHQVAKAGSRYVHDDTYVLVDPSDITKPYAEKMEYLATVRDGSKNELAEGYWLCCACATELDSHRVVPLYKALYSAEAPDFESENHEILRAIDTVREATKTRGIYVMDRGGDRGKLLLPFLERALRFIVRLKGDRHLLVRGKRRVAADLAQGCPRYYSTTVIREKKGKEKIYRLSFGFRKVKLPGRDEGLYLVVVGGFGETPLLLLTNLPVQKTYKSLWQVVGGYLTRWRIEETIRFWKQSYNVEDIRVLTYRRLRNMIALVLAACFFAAVHLGEEVKLTILACRVKEISKRLFGIPDFHYYALADGVAHILCRTGHGPRCGPPPRDPTDLQLTLFDDD